MTSDDPAQRIRACFSPELHCDCRRRCEKRAVCPPYLGFMYPTLMFGGP